MNKLIHSLLLCLAFFVMRSQTSVDAFGNYTPAQSFSHGKSLNVVSSNSPIIINQFQSPTPSVCDIAYDGSFLWVEGYSEYKIFKVSPVNGLVVKTIPSNILRPYGLEFINGHCMLLTQIIK